MITKMKHFLSWWLWRRWRIYCPKRDVSHLFEHVERMFNRGNWPCSDKPKFWPSMHLKR